MLFSLLTSFPVFLFVCLTIVSTEPLKPSLFYMILALILASQMIPVSSEIQKLGESFAG